MSILSDYEIANLVLFHNMINPSIGNSEKKNDKGEAILSYGLSSFGYDIRCGNKFKIFTNIHSTVIDPKNFDTKSFVDYEGDVCIIPPNSFVLAYSVERIKVPRDVLVVCIGKSTYARCFTGDTKIKLVDNTTISFIEMIERYDNGERFWGYGVNELNEVCVTELTYPRKIATEEIWEVLLDNGEVIRSTGDHQYIMRNGDEKMVMELQPGDSIYPLYTTEARGYEVVYDPTKGPIATHQLSDKWNILNNVYEVNTNEHRHHKDEDKRNNKPTNIERVSASEHVRQHNLKRSQDSEFIRKISESNKLAFENNIRSDEAKYSEFKERMRKQANDFWTLDLYDAQRVKLLIKMRENSKKLTRDQRIVMSERMKRIMRENPDRVEQSRKLFLELWLDDAFRQDKIDQLKERCTRHDINEETLRAALDKHGSIRGAARELNCDRSTFRRFLDVISEYKEKWESDLVTMQQMADAYLDTMSMRAAARRLNISYSYMQRRSNEWFKLIHPSAAKNHKVVSVMKTNKVEDVYCLTSKDTGNFALDAGVFVKNCGIIVNVTPLEPEWEGHITLEFSNTTTLPVKLYANEGCAQLLFFQGKNCRTSYADRSGKYQNQQSEIVLPKV